MLEVRLTFLSLVSLIISPFQIYSKFIPKWVLEVDDKPSTMVACRCSPMRKADVAGLLQQHTRKVCCIGDGGNDDSKIRATNVGVFDLLLIHKRNADSTLTRQTSLSCSWFLRYTILLPNKILSSHFCLFSDLCDTRKALSNSSRCFASFISWREQISNQVFSHMFLLWVRWGLPQFCLLAQCSLTWAKLNFGFPQILYGLSQIYQLLLHKNF